MRAAPWAAGLAALVLWAVPCAPARADGDYGPGYRFSTKRHPEWPAGMLELANLTNRVHGFFCGAQHVLFYRGTGPEFQQFLKKYAAIEGIAAHRLLLQPGKGSAKSPRSKTEGIPCDWEIYGYPAGRPAADDPAVADPGKRPYVLEVVLWLGGAIKFENLEIPKGIEVVSPDPR
jgi:hypothetical protein